MFGGGVKGGGALRNHVVLQLEVGRRQKYVTANICHILIERRNLIPSSEHYYLTFLCYQFVIKNKKPLRAQQIYFLML